MKKYLVILIFSNIIFAQPNIEWQKSYGGVGSEAASTVQQTTDGGYIVGSYTTTNGIDINGNQVVDSWVLKLDKNGGLEWKKSFGGSLVESAAHIIQTNDGGYIFASYSTSNDRDVSGNHGLADIWVVKLSSIGNIEWQKSYGGTAPDLGFTINKTNDGGYIIGGESQSNNGDVTGNHGGIDVWVLKINSTGVIQWQKTLGGSGQEAIRSVIQQTTDGGYIVAIISYSNNGDVSGNRGGADCWIVKLNSMGNIEWQKSYGGSGDESVYEIKNTLDGGYIFIGQNQINNGDVFGNHGSGDCWVVKINSLGVIQWQKSLGGTNSDGAFSIIETIEGGYIMAGVTESFDGDVVFNHGGGDWWVVKLSSFGAIEWQKSLGGSSDDGVNRIQKTADGGYILGGYSNSNNGDVTVNYGSDDLWVVKLLCSTTAPTATSNQSFCNSGTVANLSATGTNIKWYSSSALGTALVSTTALVNGNTYYASQTVNGCESSTRTPITVSIINPSVPTATPNQLFCNSATVANLGAIGSNIKWYSSSTLGTSLVFTTVLVNGTTYYASQTVSGCESSARTAVGVIITTINTPIGKTEFNDCVESLSTLNDINLNETPIHWYSSDTSNIPLDENLILTTATYYAAIYDNNGCESSIRLPVVVKIKPCGVEIYNLITINENELNNALVIKNIEFFPENNVQILDRTGLLVFSSTNYQIPDNMFYGKSNVNGVYQRDKCLPTGTYYYVISYFNSTKNETIEKKGYLYISNDK